MAFDIETAISTKQRNDGEFRFDNAVNQQLDCLWSKGSPSDKSACGATQVALINAGHAALEGNITALETAVKAGGNSFITKFNDAMSQATIPLTIDTAANNHAILIGVPDGGLKGVAIDMDLTRGTAQTQDAIFAGGSVIIGAPTTQQNVEAAAHKIAARALDASEETLLQKGNESILQRLAQTEATATSISDPREALRQVDAAFQSTTNQADACFKLLWSRRPFVQQKYNEAFPPSAQQQAHDLEVKLNAQMSQLSAADKQTLQDIPSGRGSVQDVVSLLSNHPAISDNMTNYFKLTQAAEPWANKQQEIENAANTRVGAHLLYARMLAQAGDTRARAQFDAAFQGFTPSERSHYMSDPDVIDTAKMLGITINPGINSDAIRRLTF
jgi:hypothetical protein